MQSEFFAIPLGITMGDASGVGPEILLRTLAEKEFGDAVVVYGDLAPLRAGTRKLGLEIDCTPTALTHTPSGRSIPLVNLDLLSELDWHPGEIDAASGSAARAYVLRATADALAGRIAAVVTLPINKEAIALTHPGFIGHTELIADACGVQDPVMMLATDAVSVSHVSAHVSLREAVDLAKRPRILQVIRTTHHALRVGPSNPRIAVCGLNPHAGEHGMFGNEDADEIAPAIIDAQAEGIDASGPYPADTVFYQAIHNGRFDAIIAMYHDQGHAPMKLHAFETGVNCTLGLPIVRTSVDHGTAFDIAWQGKASNSSFLCALRKARRMSVARANNL